MTLTIDVKVNGRVVATATAQNVSDLADYSDYEIMATENAYPEIGVGDLAETWRIECHNRRQSSWALVERIAAAMRLFQSERQDA